MMENKKNLRVGIYLRLSNEDKDKKEETSESIKNQRNMLYDYIKKNDNFILTDEYCDEDISGAGTYRPEFERLICDCEKRKLDIVLCKSQSRFSRDMEIIEKYIHNKFREWNIRFIGISDYADTEILGNKKARQINGLVNEWYLEDVSNNIRSAFQAKMKQGEFISPFAAFGYRVSSHNNNLLVVDFPASRVVKKIFNLYLKGLGFGKIAQYLNEEKIPSPSFYKYQLGCKLNVVSRRPREEIEWSANAVKTILTNELYLGHLIQGKRTTVSYKNHKIIKKEEKSWIRRENTHEAIIDRKTFQMVQKRIKERHRGKKKDGCIHLFSKKVYCLTCGSYMKRKNSSKYIYLVCANDKCLNKRGIRYDEMERIVLDRIRRRIEKYCDNEVLKKEWQEKMEEDFRKKIELLEKEKMEVLKAKKRQENYLKNTYQDKVDGVIDVDEFKELNTIYSSEVMNISKRLYAIDEKIRMIKMRDEEKLSINFSMESYFSLLNLRMVQEFIDKIWVRFISKEKWGVQIEIVWNNL